MSITLQKAINAVSRLPESEQDRIGQQLLDELDAEEAFDAKIAATAHRLSHLANAAVAEHEAGQTRPLDPNSL